MSKVYTITETGNAEVHSQLICPICGAAHDGDTSTWDFMSGSWTKAPLLCEHGSVLIENFNTDGDASNDDWRESVLIWPDFIQELKALGYKEF